MDSGPGGMHIEIRGERKVIHDNSALSVQRSKQGMRAIAHASFVTPSPPKRYRPGPSRRITHGAITLIMEEFSLTSACGGDGDVGPDFNRMLVLGPAPLDQVVPVAAWWIIGLTVSALVVLFVLRWFYVVTKSTKKLEEVYDYLIPRESSDKLQLRLQESERDLERAQEVLRKHPTTQSKNDYFAFLEEVIWLKNQLYEKE